MKLLVLLLILSSPIFALEDKSKKEVKAPEIIIESTKEKSKLTQIETGKPVVLHHREPVLFPDGRVAEVHYFSHKRPLPDESRRASVGLKLSSETETEMVVLNQDLTSDGKETLSTGETAGFSIKLLKLIYDDQITVEITPK